MSFTIYRPQRRQCNIIPMAFHFMPMTNHRVIFIGNTIIDVCTCNFVPVNKFFKGREWILLWFFLLLVRSANVTKRHNRTGIIETRLHSYSAMTQEMSHMCYLFFVGNGNILARRRAALKDKSLILDCGITFRVCSLVKYPIDKYWQIRPRKYHVRRPPSTKEADGGKY